MAPSRGGLRPTSAPRVAEHLEGTGGDAKGPNPFKADHSQYLQELRRQNSKVGSSSKRAKTSPSVAHLRDREREHVVLQSLERLEHKHTAERAVRDLKEVIETASVEELRRFLRTAFDPKRPLVASKARQQLLLLLRSVVRRFHSLNAATDATSALKEKVLPLLVHALRSADLVKVVVSTLHDILDCHVPEEAPEVAKEGFLQAGRAILQALMDPLALGMGWDSEVKRRCVSTLAAITPELLRRARQCAQGAEGDPQVQDLLQTYGRLLVHCLEVSSDLHEGLLQCLLQLSGEATITGLAPYARELATLCAAHLVETPSAPPAYLQQVKDLPRSESPPPRRALTRELALACCLLLERLAPLQQASNEKGMPWPQLRAQVLHAFDRENLNLQRLTRGHERIRKSIKDAKQAWEALPENLDEAKECQEGLEEPRTRNRVVQSILEMRQMEQMEADAMNAAGAEAEDASLPTGEPGPEPAEASQLPPDGLDSLQLEEMPRRSSTSMYLQDQVGRPNEVIRLESELPGHAAGRVPRTPPPCGAGRLPMDQPCEKVKPASKVDASTETGDMPTSVPSSTFADAATETTPRLEDATKPERPARPAFSVEVCPRITQLNPEDCPLLGGILDYLAAGRVDLAMQSIFSFGNEQMLRSVLGRLDSEEVWLQLPKPEAKHLVKLLVALICRDPCSSAAREACPWLESLMRSPYQTLLPAEELPKLQGALFSLSSVGGMGGPTAARIYFRLFQKTIAPSFQPVFQKSSQRTFAARENSSVAHAF